MAAGLGLLMHSEPFALRAGRALQLALVTACRVVRRPASFDVPGSLLGFRDRAGALIAARGWRITAATTASNLTLWLVLLACLRGIGLSQAQVPWQTSLAAIAFVRLLTVLPITPGGLGITELGLIATLAAGAGHRASAQVTAAVLLSPGSITSHPQVGGPGGELSSPDVPPVSVATWAGGHDCYRCCGR